MTNATVEPNADGDLLIHELRIPKNGSLFFTIFQTFMSGPPKDDKPSPYFGEYPPDFFDFIVIDECHRGGANDESTWRAILEYFKPAVQLGLTATPKRRDNVDTYAYFGEPVYVYSLKEGINDGFLTPFRVKQISTTLDEYVYTSDDTVVEGEVEAGKRYEEGDFNKIIEIKEREKYRVKLFMEKINQNEKTLVFCANQPHALAVRDLINQLKTSKDPNYCHRVTANDGALGDQHLRAFQDNEKTVPTILTTSQKLSTGVDARNIRNIVLMRPIHSIIEFKQIIGRGTRLNSELTRRNDFDKDFIMKSCLVLTDLPVVYKVQNFNNTNLTLIRENWAAIKKAVERGVDLANSFGIDRDNLTSANALIPIIYFLLKNPGVTLRGSKPFDARNAERIRRWLIMVLLKGAFGRASDNLLRDIRQVIGDLPCPGADFPVDSINGAIAKTGLSTVFDDYAAEEVLNLTYGGQQTFLALSLLYDDASWGTMQFHQDHIFASNLFKPRELAAAGREEWSWTKNRLGNLALTRS